MPLTKVLAKDPRLGCACNVHQKKGDSSLLSPARPDEEHHDKSASQPPQLPQKPIAAPGFWSDLSNAPFLKSKYLVGRLVSAASFVTSYLMPICRGASCLTCLTTPKNPQKPRQDPCKFYDCDCGVIETNLSTSAIRGAGIALVVPLLDVFCS